MRKFMKSLIQSIVDFIFGSYKPAGTPHYTVSNRVVIKKHHAKSKLQPHIKVFKKRKNRVSQNHGIQHYGKNFKVNRGRRILTLDLSSDRGRFENKLKTIWGSGLKILNDEIDSTQGNNNSERFRNQLKIKGISGIKITPYKHVIDLLDNEHFITEYEEALRNKSILKFKF